MSESARHLRIVDEDGVITEQACPHCAAKEDQIAGLQKKLTGALGHIEKLKRDKWAEAQTSRYWPYAVEVFAYWQEKCNHPNSEWMLDRYELIEPFLKSKKYGKTLEDRRDLCKRAVDGIAYDCFVTTRRNGTKKRHDGWHLIFGASDKFEECCNKAPRSAA